MNNIKQYLDLGKFFFPKNRGVQYQKALSGNLVYFMEVDLSTNIKKTRVLSLVYRTKYTIC